jgi:hypothetical protein
MADDPGEDEGRGVEEEITVPDWRNYRRVGRAALWDGRKTGFGAG